MYRTSAIFLCCLFGPLGTANAAGAWTKVVEDVWRSSGLPCAYALVDGDAAVWIGAPRGADLDSLKRRGVKRLELVLLTHHHRDTSAQAACLIRAGVPVRAPEASAPWLTVESVARFWRKAVPIPAIGREPDLKERTFNPWQSPLGGAIRPGARRGQCPLVERRPPLIPRRQADWCRRIESRFYRLECRYG